MLLYLTGRFFFSSVRFVSSLSSSLSFSPSLHLFIPVSLHSPPTVFRRWRKKGKSNNIYIHVFIYIHSIYMRIHREKNNNNKNKSFCLCEIMNFLHSSSRRGVDGTWVCKARARLPNLSENIANVDYNNTICIYYICILFTRRVNEIIYTAATAEPVTYYIPYYIHIIYIYIHAYTINSDILIFFFLRRPSQFYEFPIFIFWTLRGLDTQFWALRFFSIVNLNILLITKNKHLQ